MANSYMHTEETKLKIKNNNSRYWLGKKRGPLSIETRQKISKANSGRKLPKITEETREKLRISHIGHKPSEETIIKMSESQRGKSRGKGVKKKPRSLEHRKKISELRKGDKSHFWKGGVTSNNMIIRNSAEYKQWRLSVFTRDGWKCKKCNVKGGKLNAHHIFNFSEHKELRFNTDNGIIFCKKCHNKFHRIYGKKHNNDEQVSDFLDNKYE